MIRSVIEIDEEKCTGCGVCVPGCHEGALRIIEGKARLISDLFCDGLGACIGDCPEGAIKVIEREAEPYSERLVIESMLLKPKSVLKAHLQHLKDHNAMEYYDQAMDILAEKGLTTEFEPEPPKAFSGCPGSMAREIKRPEKIELPLAPINTKKQENMATLSHSNETGGAAKNPSELTQWPVQLHLVSPAAPYFNNKELIIMSTCGPLVSANVHDEYLKNRSVVVACPKLDKTDPYVAKLAAIFGQNNIPKITVVRLEVPCCGGLSQMTIEAARTSGKSNLTIEEHVLGVSGDLLKSTIIFKN